MHAGCLGLRRGFGMPMPVLFYKLCEVSSATLPGSGGAPTSCGQDIPGTGFLTTYQYNALDDLTQVNQGTLAPRTFTYDSLACLVCASNPEYSSATCPVTASASYIPGTTGYSYDANGNLTSKSKSSVYAVNI
jgi:hypothetical protein